MKKLTNKDILTLAQNGVLAITYHNVSAAHSYKVYKFIKALRKALSDMQAIEFDLWANVGVSDFYAFSNRLDELSAMTEMNEEEAAEYKAALDKTRAFGKVQAEMLKDEVEINVVPLPYDQWKALQDENKAVVISVGGNPTTADILVGEAEEILEDVLWALPE